MRSKILIPRLFALATCVAGIALVASCDSRFPTAASEVASGKTPGTSNNTKNGKAPTIIIDTPATGALVNVGDSIFVSVRLHDDIGLKKTTITGVTQTGSVDLGTFRQTQRYQSVTVPPSGVFRTGLKDTTVRRYLQPLSATDTTLDSLIVIVTATDSLGLADTAQVRVNLVSGPKVNIVAPVAGDSIPAGVGLSVAARAQHPDGINRIDIRVRGETTWPTKLDTTITQTYTNAPRDITFNGVVRIPADAPIRSRITVSATAVNTDRQPGSSSPVVIFVRSTAAAVPRVTQTVSPKSEFTDSVTVSATGQGITTIGLIIRDSTGAIVKADTVNLPPPFNGNVRQTVGLNLPPTQQGKKLGITAFAVDQAGRTGYAVPITTASSEPNIANALIDSTLVVYGRTFALPLQGVIGDVAVDATRGNVFLSNTEFNRLELWQSPNKSFASNGIAVGSLPWGLFVSNNPDTLLVANSGGTNISRVFIGSTTPSQMHEDLAHRILTRASYVYTVTVSRDENTGVVRFAISGPFQFSDRPQYITQSKAGRIFYSTRPTSQAPPGTIRWLDPTLPVPDPHQIYQYATFSATGTTVTFPLFNIDSVKVAKANPADPAASDGLFLYDHPYGQATGTLASSGSDFNKVVTGLATQGGQISDIDCGAGPVYALPAGAPICVGGLDVPSLALTDTTFIAASGDRTWVAFAEGHTTGAGRAVMIHDPDPSLQFPPFYSPGVTITDLTNNAAEKNFGLGLDKSGGTLAAHGLQSYFSAVLDPFHLRLQGKFDSADDGAGLAFHPNADGVLTPQDQRLAFVASASGSIEAVDIAYYIRRAKLILKNPIYGPLRASLPMPGDDPSVVLKLFAVSQAGLVVIDLTASDIKPGP